MIIFYKVKCYDLKMKYPKLIEFGKNLRIARLVKGYSMEKLAMLANLNPTHIGKIERAEMAPTLLTILALLEALEIDFNSLVTYKNAKPNTQSVDY